MEHDTFRNENDYKGGYGPCIWGGWVGARLVHGWVHACMDELRGSPCIVALLARQWAPYGTVSKCVANVTHIYVAQQG